MSQGGERRPPCPAATAGRDGDVHSHRAGSPRAVTGPEKIHMTFASYCRRRAIELYHRISLSSVPRSTRSPRSPSTLPLDSPLTLLPRGGAGAPANRQKLRSQPLALARRLGSPEVQESGDGSGRVEGLPNDEGRQVCKDAGGRKRL